MPPPRPWFFREKNEGFTVRYTDGGYPKKKSGKEMGLIRDITLTEENDDNAMKVMKNIKCYKCLYYYQK